MGDKRIYDLTKIESAPGNGVLPIDVPGSEETKGITVDNLANSLNALLAFKDFGNVSGDISHIKCGWGYNVGDDSSGVAGVFISLNNNSARFQIKISLGGDIMCFRGADFNGDFKPWRKVSFT